jgi:hypothetical protein
MAIKVLCPGCRTLFTVSDKFAGRTGPCPKCKAPITIPTESVKEVKIEGPEEQAARSGRQILAPIVFEEHPIPPAAFVAVAAGALGSAVIALIAGRFLQPDDFPRWLLAAVAFAVAVPCCWLGYEIVRDRNLAPYRGRPLLVRTLACAAVYAALWAVKGFLPPDLTNDMWPWVYLGPPFFFAGALAALASYDLDWGTGVAHYSLYVLFTASLRWLAGFMPV